MSTREERFNDVKDGRLRIYELKLDESSIIVRIMNYGATVVDVMVKCPLEDSWLNVCCGFGRFSDYLRADNPYFGATIGRVANRISDAKFELDGQTIHLDKNHGELCLHGGFNGYDKRFWEHEQSDEKSVCLSLIDEDSKFPGKVKVTVTYGIGADGAFMINYGAKLIDTTVKSTIINLTNHCYFNLNGRGAGSVRNHEMKLNNINYYLETDPKSIVPTGRLVDCMGHFNFNEYFKPLKDGIRVGLYDHCFVIDENHEQVNNRDDPAKTLHRLVNAKDVGVIRSFRTGLQMTYRTTEPSFQLYTSKYTNTKNYGPHSGFCMESQRFPDACNKPNWRNQVLLHQDDKYFQQTVYLFEPIEYDDDL